MCICIIYVGLETFPCPDFWDEQRTGTNESCDVITVSPYSQEYKDALHEFQKTLPPSKCQIIELRRIQNRHLYQQYSLLKNLMKQNIPRGCQLERELFHGTDKAACTKINQQGFNRTFAGKNGICTFSYNKATYIKFCPW